MEDELGLFGPATPAQGGDVIAKEGGDPIRKQEAGYRPAGEDSEGACEGCKHFVPPEGCTRVLGQIDPSGVCDLWEPEEADALIGAGIDEFLF